VASLKDSLRQVMAVDGVRAAALIDIATGMVVRSAGEEGTDLPAVAAIMADEVRLARSACGPGRPGGDLEEISLVTAGRVHLSKILGTRLGEGIFLFVDVDRTRVNMALASLRVGELVPAVLA
jgi:predicted regulator of Ras-like GTPase activity (Roadblock/LC7/MglB family)